MAFLAHIKLVVRLLAMQAVLSLDALANASTLSLPGSYSYIAAPGFPTSAFS